MSPRISPAPTCCLRPPRHASSTTSREADTRGITLHGVRVGAAGGFTDDWASTGIDYRVEVDSPADSSSVKQLIELVHTIAEIPRAVRAGAEVRRT